MIHVAELNARLYCKQIGADPDEIVGGCVAWIMDHALVYKPRWAWYVGASITIKIPIPKNLHLLPQLPIKEPPHEV